MRKEHNPVLTRIAALAPKTIIDGVRIFTAGEFEHWVELMSEWDCKEKMLVTCSDSELVDIVNQVRAEIKRQQISN